MYDEGVPENLIISLSPFIYLKKLKPLDVKPFNFIIPPIRQFLAAYPGDALCIISSDMFQLCLLSYSGSLGPARHRDR